MKHTVCLTDEEIAHYIALAKKYEADFIEAGCLYYKREGFNPIRVMPIGDEYQVDVVPCLGY